MLGFCKGFDVAFEITLSTRAVPSGPLGQKPGADQGLQSWLLGEWPDGKHWR